MVMPRKSYGPRLPPKSPVTGHVSLICPSFAPLKLTVPKPELVLAFAAPAESRTQPAATELQIWAAAVRAAIGFNKTMAVSTAATRHFVIVLIVGFSSLRLRAERPGSMS